MSPSIPQSPEPLSPERLAEITARAEAATKGPWLLDDDRAEIAEGSLSYVDIGQNVQIAPESEPGKIYAGKVLRRAAVFGGQHPDAVCVHRDGVLPVRRGASVARRDGPAVFPGEGVDAAERDHRLYRHDQPGSHRGPTIPNPVVEDRGLLVHRSPDPVSDVVLENPVADCPLP